MNGEPTTGPAAERPAAGRRGVLGLLGLAAVGATTLGAVPAHAADDELVIDGGQP